MKKFKFIQEAATKRKGGKKELARLLTKPIAPVQLAKVNDERYLVSWF